MNFIRHKNAIKKIFRIISFLTLLGSFNSLQAQRLSRDYEMGLLTNQVGYLPSSIKTCLIRATEKKDFEVVEISSGRVAYSGTLIPKQGDFGTYATADFSGLAKEGRYYLRADTLRSFPFTISKNVYQQPMNMIVGYFSLQRCGASSYRLFISLPYWMMGYVLTMASTRTLPAAGTMPVICENGFQQPSME